MAACSHAGHGLPSHQGGDAFMEARAAYRSLSRNVFRATARVSLLLLLAMVLPACTSGPPPFIGAAVATFAPGANPSGYRSGATVSVLKPDNGEPIDDAVVTINGVTLAYNSSLGAYVGDITIAPGSQVSLDVSSGGAHYRVSTTEFTVFPVITSPPAGSAWAEGCSIPVQWSAGAPTTAPLVSYALGILDAANPNGDTVWPQGGPVQEPISSTQETVPANVLSVGDRLLLVGITSQQPFSGADPRSAFFIGAFSYIPISITQTADTPVSIAVGPAVPVEKGTTQQFTAT